MTIKELEAQLLALTAIDKAQIIQLLTQNLASTWQGISKTPGVCGNDAISTAETLMGKVIRVYRSGLPSIS
jgi:hypothetical protein